KKAEPIPDSWDDVSSEDESEASPPSEQQPKPKETTPPKSVPLEIDLPPFLPTTGSGPPESSRRGGEGPPERRPVKSAATAQRLIAGALGVRVKPTQEQREYEKAIREKEKKRRE